MSTQRLPPPPSACLQAQARAAVQVLANTLEELTLYTSVDADWLPLLPYVRRVDLSFWRSECHTGGWVHRAAFPARLLLLLHLCSCCRHILL